MDDLKEMAGPEGVLARQDFITNQRTPLSVDRFSQIEKLIDDEMSALLVEGQVFADLFWQTNLNARQEDKSNLALFGTRVRLVKRTFSAEWFKNRFVTQKGQNQRSSPDTSRRPMPTGTA